MTLIVCLFMYSVGVISGFLMIGICMLNRIGFFKDRNSHH